MSWPTTGRPIRIVDESESRDWWSLWLPHSPHFGSQYRWLIQFNLLLIIIIVVHLSPPSSAPRCACKFVYFQNAVTSTIKIEMYNEFFFFPSQLILVLKSLGLYQNCTRFAILLQIFSHVLAYTTACINPLLYAFLSENFRKAFKKVSGKNVRRRTHTAHEHMKTVLITHNLMHIDIFNSF